MDITIFANSTLFTPMVDKETVSGKSCVDLLRDSYPGRVNGRWINGLTVMHARRQLEGYLCNRHRSNWVILCLGEVECYSHPAANFLHWGMDYLIKDPYDPVFHTLVVPNMRTAARQMTEGNAHFFPLLEPDEFRTLMRQVLVTLEGFSVILLGMSRPQEWCFEKHPYWWGPNIAYKEALTDLAFFRDNVVHIDMWNEFSQYVVDSCHMTPEGHEQLFKKIKGVIEG